jgi:hypothetical protein
MRRGLSWMLVLMALPCVALADGNAPGEIAPAGPLSLDLRLDPAQLPAAAAPPPPIGVAPADRHAAAAPASDRGLSFGVEVKPRRAAASRALVAQPDAPGLEDDLERLIEHSTLGLRGTYRF